MVLSATPARAAKAIFVPSTVSIYVRNLMPTVLAEKVSFVKPKGLDQSDNLVHSAYIDPPMEA
jgi:hypothetical protein